MSGIDIQSKVISGLNKAFSATGGASSELVYLVELSGAVSTPMNPVAPTESNVLLKDAIFKEYKLGVSPSQFDSLIQTGDRLLVSNGLVEISTSDIIEVGDDRFIVESVDVKNPAGVPLAYISLVRKQ